MHESWCLLCKNEIGNTKYDIDSNCTKYSNLQLRKMLEDVLNTKINIKPNILMCTSCFNLLNELDLAEINCKSIRKRIINSYEGIENVWTPTVEIKCDISKNDANVCAYKTDKKQLTHEYEILNIKHTSKTDSEQVILKSETVTIKSEILDLVDDNEDELKKAKSRKKKNVNSNLVKHYECKHCHKTLRSAGELKSHLAAHSDLRPFICEMCGQAYKHKASLDVHIGMHNGINPYVCNYCNKSFTQKGALRRHLPIHTGETPYQCDLCGKRFIHHSSFHFHQRTHSGEKHYKCSVCSLALFSRSHLTRHMRVHTGERKYACSICGRRFGERYNLVSHEKLHYSTEPKSRLKLNGNEKILQLDGNISQVCNEISNSHNASLEFLKSDNKTTWTIIPN